MSEAGPTPGTNGRPTGRVARISDQAKGLADDVKTWVELKLKLFELEIEERIEGLANRVVIGVIIVLAASMVWMRPRVSGVSRYFTVAAVRPSSESVVVPSVGVRDHWNRTASGSDSNDQPAGATQALSSW